MRRTPAASWLALPQPFLAREAAAIGLSRTTLTGAIRRGEVEVVVPQVYAVPRVWSALDPAAAHTALTRVAQASVPGSVVSHVSAALLHGLPRPWGPLGPVSLTVRDSTRTAHPDDWRRVLDGALPDGQLTMVDGIAVTTPARSVVDCLRTLHLRDGLAMADAALATGAVTSEGLRQVRAKQRRWPGVRRADAGIRLADGRRESWLESASVASAVALEWPVPLSQVSIHHLDGSFIARVDLLWPELGVVGEADGRGKYLGTFTDDWDADRAADHMLRERDRERELESVGLAVARWGSSALRGSSRGLHAELWRAKCRADPARVRCLWRQEPDPELRDWRSSPPQSPPPVHLLPARGHRRPRNRSA